KLARTLFHCMVRFGPKLEKRQAVLGRLVEIGAELLAISAACSRAHAMVKKDPANRAPLELADLFSRQARRRVRERFHAVWANDDVATYAAARHAMDGAYPWLEEGIV
ncbi:MAG: acyl-CoA dehydrogenase, partial [Gemmatimonadales bacterium]